ncbi:MAG: hypothetical protein AAF919_04100 [Pseudomonadota bacterium]
MSFHRFSPRDFATDESGVVSVDYVVLTAGACGLMLVFSETILGAFGVFSGTVEGELSGREVAAQSSSLSYNDGFDNGAEGWTGASATHVHGAGNVLGPIGGGTEVSRSFEVAGNGEPATFTFDVMSFDGLNGEDGIIKVDGVEVGRVSVTDGNATFIGSGTSDIDVSGFVTDNAVQIGGASLDPTSGMDSRTQVTITVNNPTSGTVDIGFSSTADGSTATESFAIDNFTATGLNNPDYTPPAAGDVTS